MTWQLQYYKLSCEDLHVKWLHTHLAAVTLVLERPNRAFFALLWGRGSLPSVCNSAMSGPHQMEWKHLWHEWKKGDKETKKDEYGWQIWKRMAMWEEEECGAGGGRDGGQFACHAIPSCNSLQGGVRQTKEPVNMHIEARTHPHATA